ncbi:hypothetical protein UY3_03686 [Chelonia mydas]|uniref:Uncharacterized protein n=1 Tax=Chelonia mydas TaxID=8469 RepID=M7CE68_CHEMY|nr:hypothetical protein UY3_03686 [Chelonia mydas]
MGLRAVMKIVYEMLQDSEVKGMIEVQSIVKATAYNSSALYINRDENNTSSVSQQELWTGCSMHLLCWLYIMNDFSSALYPEKSFFCDLQQSRKPPKETFSDYL